MNMKLSPLGTVGNAVRARGDMGLGGVPSVITLRPRFRAALLGLKAGSHVWVLGWLHKADRKVLRGRPRKISSSLAERGVFALRSPDRPNPLALTCARVSRIAGLKLYLDALDMVDGTPVVDIKPYSTGLDSVPAASQPDYSRKYGLMSDEMLARTLARILRNHFTTLKCGHFAAGALAFAYIRGCGLAPAPSAISTALGPDGRLALQALFGFGTAVSAAGDGKGSISMQVRSRGRRRAVAIGPREVREFRKRAGHGGRG